MNTGTMTPGRPAMGSWLLYGLGAESESLPGFVVMVSTGKFGQKQPIAARQWHSGFLPGQFQGVEFRGTGDPVLYVGNPKGVTPKRQRDVVDAVQTLNGIANESLDDPEIATRISQYELAFRMQSSVPELMDVKNERHPRGRRLVRLELLAGAAAGRARRAVHSALSPRLGPSRFRQRSLGRHGQRGRSGHRRADP
jgi:hypothetical protein